jgi:hypothetical protein
MRRFWMTVFSLLLIIALIGGIALADSRIRAVAYTDREPAVSINYEEPTLSVSFMGWHWSGEVSVPAKIITALSETARWALPGIGLIDSVKTVLTDCCLWAVRQAG